MIDKKATYKISYGLYVLTTTDGEKQNGCIVNTVSMITDDAYRRIRKQGELFGKTVAANRDF